MNESHKSNWEEEKTPNNNNNNICLLYFEFLCWLYTHTQVKNALKRETCIHTPSRRKNHTQRYNKQLHFLFSPFGPSDPKFGSCVCVEGGNQFVVGWINSLFSDHFFNDNLQVNYIKENPIYMLYVLTLVDDWRSCGYNPFTKIETTHYRHLIFF